MARCLGASHWVFLALSLCLRVSEGYFSIPLRIYPGKYNFSSDVDLTPARKVALTSDGNGLSLASDPTGTVNFLDMVNNLQGDSGRGYYIEMSIGTPGEKLNILVDTGSSNFAVAAAPHPFITYYFNTALSSSYVSTGRTVAVRYTQGNWEGELGVDRISLPNGPNGTININIAAILSSDGFFLPGINWQGILGLAYPMLARPDSSVEPFFNSVVRQLGIPDVFSLQMCGAGLLASSTTDPAGGSLILGGSEPTLYQGPVWYTPILEEWYYQVEVLKLEVGDQNLDLDCREYNMDKAIVDSGTTLLRLPVNVFNAVVEAITRSSLIQDFSSGFWDGTKLACWMKGETPWRFFPKLSIYLRATNTSQSFRITILPQVSRHRSHVRPAIHRRGRLAGLLPFRSVVVGQRPGDRRHRHGGLLRGVRPRSEKTGLRTQQLRSEWWSGSVGDRRSLLRRRRGRRLLRPLSEGASPVGDLLRPDGGLRHGPGRPAAPAHPALQAEGPHRGDHGRVLAGPPPHQVTERDRRGGRGGRRARGARVGGEGGDGPRLRTLQGPQSALVRLARGGGRSD